MCFPGLCDMTWRIRPGPHSGTCCKSNATNEYALWNPHMGHLGRVLTALNMSSKSKKFPWWKSMTTWKLENTSEILSGNQGGWSKGERCITSLARRYKEGKEETGKAIFSNTVLQKTPYKPLVRWAVCLTDSWQCHAQFLNRAHFNSASCKNSSQNFPSALGYLLVMYSLHPIIQWSILYTELTFIHC